MRARGRSAACWFATAVVAAGVLAVASRASPQEATDTPGTIRGAVTDSRTGEPIARALVLLRGRNRETRTDAKGLFTLTGLEPGSLELLVSTVGYGSARIVVRLPEQGTNDLEVRLDQEALRVSEGMTVVTNVFQPVETGVSEYGLNAVEVRNLSSTLIDDVLRSVQSLPGIAATRDANATFAVRGSPYTSLGFYVDGVLTSAPFHTIRESRAYESEFSLSILNGDMIDTIALMASGAPARYADRTGGVLQVRTREGDRERVAVRAHLAVTGVALTGEGPLGGRGAWLVSARRSYLDYIMDRLEANPEAMIRYYDVQGKLTFEPHRAHRLSLFALHGATHSTDSRKNLRLSEWSDARARTQFLALDWRWAPAPRVVLSAGPFLYRETGLNENRTGQDLFRTQSLQPGAHADLSWEPTPRHKTELGLLYRGLRLDEDRTLVSSAGEAEPGDSLRPRTEQTGLYLQHSFDVAPERLTATIGGRMDRLGLTGRTVWLPRASLTWSPASALRVTGGYGRYAQFPTFPQLLGPGGSLDLQAERSTQYVLGVECRLSKTLRLRVEGYDHEPRGMIFSAAGEYRLLDGRVTAPLKNAPLENSLEGASRGFDVVLQRRSANGLSGWASYSFGHVRLLDWRSGQSFDGDFDQAHAASVYASYRASESLNVSAKYIYGTGLPIPGFYQRLLGEERISAERNRLRNDAYSRLDVRLNKAFLRHRPRVTLYGEILNLLNHDNDRLMGLDSVNRSTGVVEFESNFSIPLLPVVGLTIEF